MQRTSAVSVAIACLIAFLTACSPSEFNAPTEPVSAAVTVVNNEGLPTPTPPVIDSIARAFAMALSEQAHRSTLVSAMRSSPKVDGQLDATILFSSPALRDLTRSIERANRWGSGGLVERLRRYSGLGVYIPFRNQRSRWTGDEAVLVAGMLNSENDTATAYSALGASMLLTPAAARVGSSVVVLIAPKEASSDRTQLRQFGPVQEAGERGEEPDITYVSRSGDTTITSLSAVLSGTDPNFVIVSMSSESDTTRVDYLKVVGYEDGWGALEMRLKTKFYRPDGSLDGEITYAQNDVSPDQDYYPAAVLVHRRIPDASTAKIRIEVWEDDCGCFGNDDDYYGQRDFFVGDRGETRQIFGGTGGPQDNYTFIELDWTSKAASVGSSIALSVSSYTIAVGGGTGLSAAVLDQYGYVMPQASPNWAVNAPEVLGLDAAQGATTYGSGLAEGGAVVYASWAGLSTSAYVAVTSGGGGNPCPDNQIQCEPMRASLRITAPLTPNRLP